MSTCKHVIHLIITYYTFQNKKYVSYKYNSTKDDTCMNTNYNFSTANQNRLKLVGFLHKVTCDYLHSISAYIYIYIYIYMYNIYHGYISDDAIFAFLRMRSIDILSHTHMLTKNVEDSSVSSSLIGGRERR